MGAVREAVTVPGRTGGGAHQAPEAENVGAPRAQAEPNTALRGYTDQFEVLKVSKRPNQAK